MPQQAACDPACWPSALLLQWTAKLIVEGLLLDLIKVQQSIGHAAGALTLAGIFEVTDEALILMGVEYVRWKYTQDQVGLSKTIMGLGPVVRAITDGYNFSIDGYDRELHPKVQEFLKQRERGWKLLIKNITSTERENWPKERFGTGKNVLILNMFHHGLGSYGQFFETVITIDKLKKMNSVEEYLAAVRAVDNRLLVQSSDFRRNNAKFRPPVPLDELSAQMNRNRPTHMLTRPKEESAKRSVAFGSPGYPKMTSWRSDTDNRDRPSKPALSISDKFPNCIDLDANSITPIVS